MNKAARQGVKLSTTSMFYGNDFRFCEIFGRIFSFSAFICFSPRTSKEWNILPLYLRQMETLELFKSAVRAYVLSICFCCYDSQYFVIYVF